MKTTMKFTELILAVAVVALCLASCGNNSQAKQQEIERQRQDSIQAAERVERERAEQERAEREEAERAEAERRERESFTTSLGTFSIQEALDSSYQKGASNGASWGKPEDRSYDPEWRTEEKFKLYWTRNYGIPNNEKAQDVYRQAYERYTQGWDDAVNF